MSKYKKLLQELEYVEDAKGNDLVQNLLAVPKKDKSCEATHTICPTKNYINQVDVLFLPEDKTVIKGSAKRVKKEFEQVNKIRLAEKQTFKTDCGKKYLLVCVDIATSMCDAEPIKYKYPFIVRDALKRIYGRKILKLPHEIEVDAGNEFKADFSTHFNNVSNVRVKKAGRHRAQAVVEGINSLLSQILQTRMIAEELINKEYSREWVDEIPNVVTAANKTFSHDPPETEIVNHESIKVKKGTLASNILPEGTAVRIQLDNPVDAVKTKRLNGKFRIGDIRWENVVRHNTQVYLRPDFPPMYQVDNDDNVAYTRNQLQVVLANEKKPSKKLRKRELVEKLLDVL
jgi:hypothetical protein